MLNLYFKILLELLRINSLHRIINTDSHKLKILLSSMHSRKPGLNFKLYFNIFVNIQDGSYITNYTLIQKLLAFLKIFLLRRLVSH